MKRTLDTRVCNSILYPCQQVSGVADGLPIFVLLSDSLMTHSRRKQTYHVVPVSPAKTNIQVITREKVGQRSSRCRCPQREKCTRSQGFAMMSVPWEEESAARAVRRGSSGEAWPLACAIRKRRKSGTYHTASSAETSPQSRASVIWPHFRVREFAHLRQELRDRRHLGSYAWLQSPREACQTNCTAVRAQGNAKITMRNGTPRGCTCNYTLAADGRVRADKLHRFTRAIPLVKKVAFHTW